MTEEVRSMAKVPFLYYWVSRDDRERKRRK